MEIERTTSLNAVRVECCDDYAPDTLRTALAPFRSDLARLIRPGDRVVLKPNWLAAAHKHRADEWQSVITHPAVITGVLQIVLECLDGNGHVTITDGPMTDQRFDAIMDRMRVPEWHDMCRASSVTLDILDLRDHEWIVERDVLIERRELPGDTRGSVEFNLNGDSEFVGHTPSQRGYYGADYDTNETTAAHTRGHHRYRVSKTVIESDVFINLPKWKTHKKAGITCSLKNLVGINTYRNFLPHHTEGVPSAGGDQFPDSNAKNRLEVSLLRWFKRALVQFPGLSRLAIPVKRVGARFFGETVNTIRNGAWHGNDTLWRTILDLNKILLYGNPDGTLRHPDRSNRKRYYSIIDGIIAGERHGPEAPDPVVAGRLIGGADPVAVDCTAARLMGFDYRRIPSLRQAFRVRTLELTDQEYEELDVVSNSDVRLNCRLADVDAGSCLSFVPHFGWQGRIELALPELSTADSQEAGIEV